MMRIKKKNIGVVSIVVLIISTSSLFIYYTKLLKKNNDQMIYDLKIVKTIQKLSNVKTTNLINEYKKEFNNDDIVGHISIEDTNVNYIFVQGNDNEYYLTHNLSKEENKVGSVFLDYKNKVTDKKLILYGHSFEHYNGPFNDLENYDTEEYFNDHKNIEIIINNQIKNYVIFSVMIIKKSSKEFEFLKLEFDDEEYIEHLKYLKENSIYDTLVETNNEDIIVLQTCYQKQNKSFIVVSARKE